MMGTMTLQVADQAQSLRGLMQRLQTEASEPAIPTTGRACAIAVTSGKGGVGKTNIALNLAIALSRFDAKTCLVDANLGLGNIDLLCGLNGYWNLAHVVTGARNVREIVLAGPEGIDVLPGAGVLSEHTEWAPSARADVFQQLIQFEESYDFLVIDAAAGIHRLMRGLLDSCEVVLVVTTPETTSIADAYASIKSLAGSGIPHVEVLVNQSDSAEQAQLIAERVKETARMFLHADIHAGGFVPRDPQLQAAVARRRPVVIDSPTAPVSMAIDQLAQRLKQRYDGTSRRGSFFLRLQHHRVRRSA
jgi:flagellar biosynthesis protein FlhG